MKELSIEKKAKAYDKVVNKLRRFIEQGVDPLITKADVQDFFPELKESEDDRVREDIISLVNKWWKDDGAVTPNFSTRAEMMAWLEKQGEQKPAEYTLEQAAGIFLDALSNTPYNNKPITDAQVITKELLKFLSDVSSYNPNALNEQKPAWSEEDEDYLKAAIWYAENPAPKVVKNAMLVEWLKNLRGRVQQQPKQEWSKEDETMLNNLIYELAIDSIGNNRDEYVEWLKSLKDRYTWKPSDEQMKALRKASKNEYLTAEQYDILVSLYDDLKKLREE